MGGADRGRRVRVGACVMLTSPLSDRRNVKIRNKRRSEAVVCLSSGAEGDLRR